ncbi:WSC domain-containing protein [Xylariomycetidae sp. FL2044]|nr:WSC domain-containing protein [Xylariomycetidae sp. FL2044]
MAKLSVLAAFAALNAIHGVQAWFPELPSCISPFEPYVPSGCYDSLRNSGLDPLVLRTDMNIYNMTVEQCTARCKGNGFKYAGLTYGGVCYCGQTCDAPPVPQQQCNRACTGNNAETCGGDYALSLYSDPTFTTMDNTYDYAGCWTDNVYGKRAIYPRDESIPANAMTIEKCQGACDAGDFAFAGLEYGGECYCGVLIGNGSSLAANPADCNVPCTGAPREICGGGNRLSLYVSRKYLSSQPCRRRVGDPPPTTTTGSSGWCTSTVMCYATGLPTVTPAGVAVESFEDWPIFR